MRPITQPLMSMSVTPAYCGQMLDKVDDLVSKHFWKVESVAAWKTAVATLRPKILSSNNLVELDANINEALSSLHASHTQFVTVNDEIFYFLKTMFGHARKKKPLLMDFTGFVTGGGDCKPNQVRYVLDGGPADAAGLKPGDDIVSVDGEPYMGQFSFDGKAGKPVVIHVLRTDVGERTLTVKPIRADDFQQYLDATKRSVSITKREGKKIGYIHVWCGGGEEHDIIEEALGGKLQASDGLIFDIRDGYGGNYYNDLDYFYRPAAGYPLWRTMSREGKHEDNYMYYDKPLVALINAGSRSGKELVALSLKKTQRATLVGERTAGFVLGGRLFDLDDRCAIYLAVEGPTSDSVNLEGIGVDPDIVVKRTCDERGKGDAQLDTATKTLLEKLKPASVP
jgi:carboxyl-terminal processing protease